MEWGEWEDVSDDTSIRGISVPPNGVSTHFLPAHPISRLHNPTASTPLHRPVNSPELDTAPRDEAVRSNLPFVTIGHPLWFGHDFNDVAPISNSRADEAGVPAFGRLRRVYLDQDAQ
jgi:hypothetical protein